MVWIRDFHPHATSDELIGKISERIMDRGSVARHALYRVFSDHGADLLPIGEQPDLVGLECAVVKRGGGAVQDPRSARDTFPRWDIVAGSALYGEGNHASTAARAGTRLIGVWRSVAVPVRHGCLFYPHSRNVGCGSAKLQNSTVREPARSNALAIQKVRWALCADHSDGRPAAYAHEQYSQPMFADRGLSTRDYDLLRALAVSLEFMNDRRAMADATHGLRENLCHFPSMFAKVIEIRTVDEYHTATATLADLGHGPLAITCAHVLKDFVEP